MKVLVGADGNRPFGLSGEGPLVAEALVSDVTVTKWHAAYWQRPNHLNLNGRRQEGREVKLICLIFRVLRLCGQLGCLPVARLRN